MDTLLLNINTPTLQLINNNLQGVTGAKGDKGNTGEGVPTGGSTGQVLRKVSGTDFDTNWQSISYYISLPFSSETDINIVHGFGAYPIVQVLDFFNAVMLPDNIIHNSVNDFTVSFSSITSGTIIAMAVKTT